MSMNEGICVNIGQYLVVWATKINYMRKFAALCVPLILATTSYIYSQTKKERQASASPSAGAGKEPVKVTDLLKIKSVGEIALSKDGSQAAFVVTEIEKDSTGKSAGSDSKAG